MHFAELVRQMRSLGVARADEPHRPARDSIRAVQHSVAAGLCDGELLVDCIGLELASIATRPARGDLEPFFVDPIMGVRFAFAYWGPGKAAGAHEHNDWTVTAVCHNRLDVETYDWEAARFKRVLEPRKLHHAACGQAGHIYDPCIHNPRNPTARWSMSFHIISPHDGPILEKQVGPIQGLMSEPRDEPRPGEPIFALVRCVRQQRTYRVLAEILSRCRGARALALLDDIYGRGNLETRRTAALAISVIDGAAGADRMRDVAVRELCLDSDVVRGSAAIELAVRRRGSQAELIVERGERPIVLLRLDAWAEDALQFAASSPGFAIRALPGKLGEIDRVSLTRALIDLGLFNVMPRMVS